jgi:hypothetical protein
MRAQVVGQSEQRQGVVDAGQLALGEIDLFLDRSTAAKR